MIIRNKDTEILEVQISNDIIYLGKNNAVENFKNYLRTKLMEFEKELTKMVYQGNMYVPEKPNIIIE